MYSGSNLHRAVEFEAKRNGGVQLKCDQSQPALPGAARLYALVTVTPKSKHAFGSMGIDLNRKTILQYGQRL
jgi:hypothetical protein